MDREVLESTSEIARLKDLCDSLRKDSSDLTAKHQEALDAFGEAENEQRTLKSGYEACKAEKESLRDQVDQLNKDNERWSTILAELRSEIAVLGTEHTSQMETAEEYRSKVDRLKGVLAGKKEVSEKLREQLETEEVNKLEEQIKEQSYLVSAQEDALEARNRMCARLQAESEELQNDLLKYRSSFEARQEEIAVLTQTIGDKEKQLAVLKNESERFIAEFTKHEANMKKAKIFDHY
jgi:chromosome segregation ATPase